MIRLDDGSEWQAHCVELSIGGMTLHADYVPGEAEQFVVEVGSPEGRVERPPLVVRVEVKRCNLIDEGIYELGLATIDVIA